MAVSPQEALGDKLEREKQAIESAELYFDEELCKRYDGRNPVTIDLPSVCNQFVQEEIQRRYEAAGWALKLNSSQKDGDSFTFAPKG